MAVVTIPQQDRTIESPEEIAAFLAPHGIQYEQWPLEDRVDPDASEQDILDAYEPELRRIMDAGGYVTADVINITPDTPNLEALLAKFDKEHTHTEDEVRFILKGRGIFHIHPQDGRDVFSVETRGGDMISVPAGTQHWFNLCDDRSVRAVRLFQDKTGWTPHYTESDVHSRFIPVCWGPQFIAPAQTYKAAVGS